MVGHVLVPFDGSELSRRALTYVCSSLHPDTVTVLYVVDSHTDRTAASGWGDHPSEWEDWLEERRGHAEELFDDARAIAAEHDQAIDTAVAVGRVTEMVLRVAAEYDVDLLAVGTHGQRPLTEFVVGDVAKALVRRSPVPVLTVR